MLVPPVFAEVRHRFLVLGGHRLGNRTPAEQLVHSLTAGQAHPLATLGLVVGAPLLVFGAIALEIVGGANANSPVASWGDLFPIAWPPALRVVWWILVAGAALGFRVGLADVGAKPNRVVTALIVAPFLAFAAGIAIGADWATWH